MGLSERGKCLYVYAVLYTRVVHFDTNLEGRRTFTVCLQVLENKLDQMRAPASIPVGKM